MAGKGWNAVINQGTGRASSIRGHGQPPLALPSVPRSVDLILRQLFFSSVRLDVASVRITQAAPHAASDFAARQKCQFKQKLAQVGSAKPARSF